MIRRSLALLVVLVAFLSCAEPPPTRSHAQLLQDAERSMLQGLWEKAAGQYESFLAENPGDAQHAEIRTQIGKCRLAAGHLDTAIRAFDQALLEQPSSTLKAERSKLPPEMVRSVKPFRLIARFTGAAIFSTWSESKSVGVVLPPRIAGELPTKVTVEAVPSNAALLVKLPDTLKSPTAATAPRIVR